MPDAATRFARKVTPDESGCLLWTGSRNSTGYGTFWDGARTVTAHRFAYGPIPPGLELDHLCRVRHCVNVDHLEPVTHTENCRRGRAVEVNTARQRAATHCRHGHEYTEATVYTWHGRRYCRLCRRAVDHRRRGNRHA